jgi:hypothetical protein
MGAGAFIMAEITGIQYREIVIAAIIPALLYFLSVYFMVDKEALRKGMKGLPRDELPKFRAGPAGLSVHSHRHPDRRALRRLLGDPGGHLRDDRGRVSYLVFLEAGSPRGVPDGWRCAFYV